MVDHQLERRFGTWDSWLWNLHQLMKDINGEAACKWVKQEDEDAIDTILDLLKQVDIVATTRYCDVLTDKISALKDKPYEP